MRYSPLALLALAAISLFPAALSAHPHRIRQSPPPRRLATRNNRSVHPQHPQPAVFHPAALPLARRHHKLSRVEAAPSRNLRSSETAHSRRRARGEDFLAATAPREISRPLTARRLHAATYITRSESQHPLTPVVSIIRPTADKPQLPSVQQAATEPIVLPQLYNQRGRLIVPRPLFGSHEILVHQNEVADQDGLGRVQDDSDLDGMRAKEMLVGIPVSDALRVDERLASNRRYCRPWTAQFLANLAHAHYARFHTPLQVNSAVRTVEFQLRLQRTNGNAAPAEGDTASPHLTGQAIDIAKHGLSLSEIAWLRGYLLPLIQEGRVDVEEEFQQSCFHISVYRRYLPPDATPRRYNVTSRGTSALALAIH